MRIHQRTCKTIEGLAKTVNREILNVLSNEGNLEDHDMDVILTESPFLKPGVKLPNTTTEWSTANAYFQTRFSANNNPDDGNLDDCVAEMNEVI